MRVTRFIDALKWLFWGHSRRQNSGDAYQNAVPQVPAQCSNQCLDALLEAQAVGSISDLCKEGPSFHSSMFSCRNCLTASSNGTSPSNGTDWLSMVKAVADILDNCDSHDDIPAPSPVHKTLTPSKQPHSVTASSSMTAATATPTQSIIIIYPSGKSFDPPRFRHSPPLAIIVPAVVVSVVVIVLGILFGILLVRKKRCPRKSFRVQSLQFNQKDKPELSSDGMRLELDALSSSGPRFYSAKHINYIEIAELPVPEPVGSEMDTEGRNRDK